MPDQEHFSEKLLAHPDAQNAEVRRRIAIAKKRIQSVLDRETVAHQKTLEQKIAEQGPDDQRVDPHLIGLAIFDLLELRRLRKHTHPATGARSPWFSNLLTPDDALTLRLDELAPLYASVSGDGFGNLTGDALEVVVFKCLEKIFSANRRFAYLGMFHLDAPKNDQSRFRKSQPPKNVGSKSTKKEADFIQFGHAEGPLCIECKNYREWLYPHHEIIKQLIIKAADLSAIPVLIQRRIHYSAMTNFLEPAGIIAHESYYQYFPSDQHELADRARHKRSLGFTDILATESPHARTVTFFETLLPKIVPHMADRWYRFQDALIEYANDRINLAQLYTEIGSPAGGKWQDFSKVEPPEH